MTHRIPGALRHGEFRRLLAALAISQLGDWLYNVALLAVVYERTHSSGWLALTTAARVLPVVLLSPFGGVLADRFDRRRIMIASDLSRALLMAALWAVTVAGLPAVLLPVIAAAATAGAAPYAPSASATLPRVLPAADLAGGNALRSAVGSASIVVGPAAGAALMMVAAPATAFLANAVSFLASAAIVAGIRRPGIFAPPPSADGERPRLFADLSTGWRALRANATARHLVGADITCSVVYGAQTVLLVLLSQSLGADGDGYGLLLAATGAGGLVGTVAGARAARIGNRRLVLGGALVAVAAPLALLAVVPVLAGALVLAALIGAGSLMVEVLADTGLQQVLDADVLARAYGFSFPAAIGGIVVGSLIAGPLHMLLGLDGSLLALGAGVAVHAAVLLSGRRAARPALDPSPATA
jgi:MFS family permease